ncbi:MAG: HAD family hydrolase [Treponema sp.]|jgi:phosphoglycolate phosphatase/putative hydrolase of the HAD superfamily|nr:HAD family hydrolase [Treponema sp.]
MKIFSLPPGAVQGLIFDMDGTLYTHPEYLASQSELPLRRLAESQHKTYEVMKAEFDAYRANWQKEHQDDPSRAKISMGNTFKFFGITIEENVKWREELYQPEQYLKPDPVLRKTLERLAVSRRIAVVTNNPVSIARRTLGCLGVEIPVVIGLDTCMVSKPHRAPFQAALDLLGCPAERCVAIGDRYEIDLALPIEMGMGGILVDGVEDVYTLPELLG